MHWPHEQILSLEHHERRRWVDQVSKINRQLNDEPENPFDVFAKR